MVILTAVCRSDRTRRPAGPRPTGRGLRALVGALAAAALAAAGVTACAGTQEEPAAREEDAATPAADEPADLPPDPSADTPAEAAGRRWLFVVFSRPIDDADLAWLEEKEFHVDTLLGPTSLRGWMRRPDADLGAMVRDPRIESVEPLMR